MTVCVPVEPVGGALLTGCRKLGGGGDLQGCNGGSAGSWRAVNGYVRKPFGGKSVVG